jgi:signal transduction histidine kinase
MKIAVAIQNVQLAQKALQAERRAAIGEAVSGVAHCVKNMLNGLHGGLYVARSDMKRAPGDVSSTGFEMLERNLGRLTDLVRDMLSCSKERKPEYEQADINTVVDSVVELMRQKAGENELELVFKPDNSLGEVSIDPKGIYRCLLNLVSNALDACKDRKGAEVNVSTVNGRQEEVAIKVADQGCGMDEATLNSIFNPFFSGKGSAGTGLGLTVTQKIVEEHNGRIEVDSEIGKGTTFIVYLPKQKKKTVPI